MPLPSPKRISGAAKTAFGLIFLGYGLLGFAYMFYPRTIPAEVLSAIPEQVSVLWLVATRESIILVSAFVSLIAGIILMVRRE